jgi:hypothetical protein
MLAPETHHMYIRNQSNRTWKIMYRAENRTSDKGEPSISARKPVPQSRTVKITSILTESAQIHTASAARSTETRRRGRSDTEKLKNNKRDSKRSEGGNHLKRRREERGSVRESGGARCAAVNPRSGSRIRRRRWGTAQRRREKNEGLRSAARGGF